MKTPRDDSLLARYAESANVPALRRLAQAERERPADTQHAGSPISRAHAREGAGWRIRPNYG